MISCRSVTKMHTDAKEHALSWLQALRYRLHMKVCPSCQAYRASFDRTLSALREVPKEAAPDDVKRAALAALRAKKG